MRIEQDFPTIPMPELRLYHSRKKARRFLEGHGVPFEPAESMDAQTWMFCDGTGDYAVVLFGAGDAYEPWEDAGMLAHEATHVMLYALGRIGEEEPAEEEMCYLVQAVTRWLLKAHMQWRARRGRMMPRSEDAR